MFDLIVIVTRYLFVFYIIYFLAQGVAYIAAERAGPQQAGRRKQAGLRMRAAAAKQRVAIVFMHLSAYLILAYRPGEFRFDYRTLLVGAAGFVFIALGQFAAERVYKNSCPLLWNGVFFLLDTGLIMLQRITGFAERQIVWFAVGFTVMLLLPFVLKLIPRFENLERLYLYAGLLLLALTSVVGVKKFGAYHTIKILSLNVQPSEAVKFLFVFYLASVFRKQLTLRDMLFPTAMSAVLAAILTYQRDLGAALIFFTTFMLMHYIATGSAWFFAAGLTSLAAASVVAYKIFAHISVRITAWHNPWSDASGDGYQIIQALFAIGGGGLWGAGLTRGALTIPVLESDSIFAAICEEFGVVFGIGLIAVFIMVFYRGVNVALRCKKRYYALLAAGFIIILAFQAFLILGGITKLIPLTGVTLPFVSYGGSSIVICLMMAGILQWIYGKERG
ncbi:MAG: FtsW/RodA/SpoVE family cell cycle protein [Clostridiales bacterium]|jgi:cell division protein FtsW (lipid II flippase)|nr:FtsW/RodA/SpoVE family cell cycle protein [Clostridiales bacterium]